MGHLRLTFKDEAPYSQFPPKIFFGAYDLAPKRAPHARRQPLRLAGSRHAPNAPGKAFNYWYWCGPLASMIGMVRAGRPGTTDEQGSARLLRLQPSESQSGG
jgi:hypothetical protein